MRLHQEESALFGSSAGDGAAACFSLRVIYKPHQQTLQVVNPGLQYLLGLGLYKHNSGCLRTAIRANDCFEVGLVFRDHSVDVEDLKGQLKDTLLAFGLFGGLGSRARKGFGSVAIEELIINGEQADIPANAPDIQHYLSHFKLHNQLPPLTAFSNFTRLDISMYGVDGMSLLEEAGIGLQKYRSWGMKSPNGDHKVLGGVAEQNFENDHDLMFEAIHTKKYPTTIPKRSIFGLPHNYFYSSTKKKSDFSCSEKNRSRRASPLFLHVHQFPNGGYVLMQMLLPAVFLSEGDKLEFKVGNSKKQIGFDGSQMIDWKVITD